MPTAQYNPDAPRKSLNVLVNSDLIQCVKDANINISKLVTEAMEKAYREHKAQEWLRENQQAIAALHDFYAQHGSFADKMRAHLNETV